MTLGTSTAMTATGMNSLSNSLTACAQTNLVTTGTGSNVQDAIVQVKAVLGAITPSTSTLIHIFAFGSEDGTKMPGGASSAEVLGGGAGSVTLSANGHNLRYIGSISCHTASIAITSEPMSIAAAFAGVMPRKWGLVIQNQSGAALAASGHAISYSEVT